MVIVYWLLVIAYGSGKSFFGESIAGELLCGE